MDFSSVQRSREKFKIYQYRNQILYALHHSQILIITGSSGTGKSTQICQYLMEVGYADQNMIYQASHSIELTFENVYRQTLFPSQSVEAESKVAFMTENQTAQILFLSYLQLIQKFINDPQFSKCSALILDDLEVDNPYSSFFLKLLTTEKFSKSLLNKKLILITNHFHKAEELYQKFQDFKVELLSVDSKPFPVEIHHLSQPASDLIQSAICTAYDCHLNFAFPSDLLVTMPSEDACKKFEMAFGIYKPSTSSKIPLKLFPYYKNKETPQQTSKERQLILMTTEMALYEWEDCQCPILIDSGKIQVRKFIKEKNVFTKSEERISQQNAEQLASLVGSQRPGRVYRMYTKEELNKEKNTNDFDLSHILLIMKSLDLQWSYLNWQPDVSLLSKAYQTLVTIEALDSDLNLTKIGRFIASLPLENVYLSKLLYLSIYEFNCAFEVLHIIAMLQMGDELLLELKKNQKMKEKNLHLNGDFLPLCHVLVKYRQNTNFKSLRFSSEFLQSASKHYDFLYNYLVKNLSLQIQPSSSVTSNQILNCISKALAPHLLQIKASIPSVSQKPKFSFEEDLDEDESFKFGSSGKSEKRFQTVGLKNDFEVCISKTSLYANADQISNLYLVYLDLTKDDKRINASLLSPVIDQSTLSNCPLYKIK